jgi:hypothetical protein
LPRARIEPDRLNVGVLAPWKQPEDMGRAAAETWLEVFAAPGASLPEPADPVDAVDGLLIHRDPSPQIDNLVGGARRGRYRISLEIDAKGIPAGVFARSFSIPVAGGPPASATVSGEVHAPTACVPARVHFGMLSPGDSAVTKQVTVKSVEGGPFRLESTSADGGGLTVRIDDGVESVPAGTEHHVDLTLAIPHDETRRTLAGTVRIRTDNASFPEVRIPWSVFIRRPDVRTASGLALP